MINIDEVKAKILKIIELNGPVLPVHVARKTELSPIFATAILSELVSDGKLVMSNLKVGSSSLYLLKGQENKLEEFSENLNNIERKAFLKLKERKILEDETQEPAIRVALRSIKDFSIPIKFNNKIYWRYFLTTSEELQQLLSQNEKKIVEERSPQKEIIEKPKEKVEQIKEEPKPEQQEKPLLEIKEKKKREKVTPEKFLNEVKEFLESRDIELVKEISIDKKEIIGTVRINSDLGKISLLMIAKDKKKANVADLTMAYQKALHEKMSCYLLTREGVAKTTEIFIEEHKNLIKVDKLG